MPKNHFRMILIGIMGISMIVGAASAAVSLSFDDSSEHYCDEIIPLTISGNYSYVEITGPDGYLVREDPKTLASYAYDMEWRRGARWGKVPLGMSETINEPGTVCWQTSFAPAGSYQISVVEENQTVTRDVYLTKPEITSLSINDNVTPSQDIAYWVDGTVTGNPPAILLKLYDPTTGEGVLTSAKVKSGKFSAYFLNNWDYGDGEIDLVACTKGTDIEELLRSPSSYKGYYKMLKYDVPGTETTTNVSASQAPVAKAAVAEPSVVEEQMSRDVVEEPNALLRVEDLSPTPAQVEENTTTDDELKKQIEDLNKKVEDQQKQLDEQQTLIDKIVAFFGGILGGN